MVGTSAAAAWSVEQVVAWLERQVGLREHSPAFRTNGIDGEMLLLLSEDDLRDDLGIESRDHVARLLVSIGQLAAPAEQSLSATRSLQGGSGDEDQVLGAPRSLPAAVTIQAAARGWRSRRQTAAMRTPSRWLVCGDGPHERQYFFNEMTLVSTYTPPPVLEKYLEAGADGVARLRRAANEPTAQISPPGMLAPGQRPLWAQVDNGFAGVDRPRPSLEPGRPPPAFVKPLSDHVVEAAPQEAVTLPPPRWQPHALPVFEILKGSKEAAAAQPKIAVPAEILGEKVLPAIGAALVPTALGSHQMGDRRKQPSAHVPLANLAAALADPPAVDSTSDTQQQLLPEDPVTVLYDQLRPALRAALSQGSALASEAEGGGVAAVSRELQGWVSGRATGPGARGAVGTMGERGRMGRAGAGAGAGAGGRGRHMAAGRRGRALAEPQPEPEPEVGAAVSAAVSGSGGGGGGGSSSSVGEVIGGMSLFKSVRAQQRAAVIRYLKPKSYSSGELICREGDLSNEFYIVQSGEVRAVKSRGTTKEVLLKTIRAGEYFGELALLTDAPRAASCVASAPGTVGGGRVELLELSRADFDRALGTYKDMIKKQMMNAASVYSTSAAAAGGGAGGSAMISVAQAEEQRAEERKAALLRTFNEIDSDGSGSIDRDEVREMLTKLGKSSSDAMLEKAMSMMDPDGDGLITFDEFRRFWGEDGSGVDRLAKMEAAIGGMLERASAAAGGDTSSSSAASPKKGPGSPKAAAGSLAALGRSNTHKALVGADDDDEDDSDDEWGNEWGD